MRKNAKIAKDWTEEGKEETERENYKRKSTERHKDNIKETRKEETEK